MRAQVARDPHALVEDLDGVGARAGVELFADQGMRDRVVVVVVDLDVVVDVHACLRPLGEDVGDGRQRAQGRAVEGLEETLARARELLEGPLVDALDEGADGGVELPEREERPVPQGRQHPALDELHARLDLGLVPGFAHPRRDHRHPVVRRLPSA
jgi:hypothetical protein